MGIYQLPYLLTGDVQLFPSFKSMVTSDNLSTVTTAGYLNSYNLQANPVGNGDIIYMLYGATINQGGSYSGTYGIFTVAVSGKGVITLSEWINPGDVLLPVMDGDIAVFNGNLGQIKDAGISSTNPIFLGNVQAGKSGVSGEFVSYPASLANGNLQLKAINNSAGNFTTTISNASSVAQNQIVSVPDAGGASANLIMSNSLAGQTINSALTVNNSLQSNQLTVTKYGTMNGHPIVATNLISATSAALASAGKVNVYVPPSGTAQIVLLDVKVFFSPGLSGGGGNRLLSLTDGTIVFNNTGISATLLGTPACTVWGGSGNPIPTGSQQNVSTAGATVYFQYISGTTDYTAGSVLIAVTYAQVTN